MTNIASSSSLGLTLWRQTWPMAIGVLALLGFQLVDSAFLASPRRRQQLLHRRID